MTAILFLALVLGIEPPTAAPTPSDPETSSIQAHETPETPETGELPAMGEIEVATPEELEADERSERAERRSQTRSGMPDAFASDDYGPFFEDDPKSDLTQASPRRKAHPPLSVGKGWFCFVDNSKCKISVLADSDVGAGLNVITSGRGIDVPYTQFRTRFGLAVRPISIKRRADQDGGWHPWGVGIVGSYSIGSASIASSGDTSEGFDDVRETSPIHAFRVGLINQLWLSKKHNSFHLDFTLGGVNSTVLAAPGRFWGTTVELSGTWGGWGGMFLSGDFLDRDTRVVAGVRVHDVAAGPIIGLVLLGLLAGGAL